MAELLSNSEIGLLAQSLLGEGRSCSFRALGSSMCPFIKDGDVAMLDSVDGKVLRIGNVVGVLNPETGRFLLHRIVAMSGGKYLIKGDNCSDVDGYVDRSSIVGSVSMVERGGRSIRFGHGFGGLFVAFLSRTGVLGFLQSCYGLWHKKAISA